MRDIPDYYDPDKVAEESYKARYERRSETEEEAEWEIVDWELSRMRNEE